MSFGDIAPKFTPRVRRGLTFSLVNPYNFVTPIILSSYNPSPLFLESVFNLKTASGTIVATLSINGNPIGGMNGITASSSAQFITLSSPNILNYNDTLTLNLSGNASASAFQFTLIVRGQ